MTTGANGHSLSHLLSLSLSPLIRSSDLSQLASAITQCTRTHECHFIHFSYPRIWTVHYLIYTSQLATASSCSILLASFFLSLSSLFTRAHNNTSRLLHQLCSLPLSISLVQQYLHCTTGYAKIIPSLFLASFNAHLTLSCARSSHSIYLPLFTSLRSTSAIFQCLSLSEYWTLCWNLNRHQILLLDRCSHRKLLLMNQSMINKSLSTSERWLWPLAWVIKMTTRSSRSLVISHPSH